MLIIYRTINYFLAHGFKKTFFKILEKINEKNKIFFSKYKNYYELKVSKYILQTVHFDENNLETVLIGNSHFIKLCKKKISRFSYIDTNANNFLTYSSPIAFSKNVSNFFKFADQLNQKSPFIFFLLSDSNNLKILNLLKKISFSYSIGVILNDNELEKIIKNPDSILDFLLIEKKILNNNRILLNKLEKKIFELNLSEINKSFMNIKAFADVNYRNNEKILSNFFLNKNIIKFTNSLFIETKAFHTADEIHYKLSDGKLSSKFIQDFSQKSDKLFINVKLCLRK